jgi:hypothetical protein
METTVLEIVRSASGEVACYGELGNWVEHLWDSQDEAHTWLASGGFKLFRVVRGKHGHREDAADHISGFYVKVA